MEPATGRKFTTPRMRELIHRFFQHYQASSFNADMQKNVVKTFFQNIKTFCSADEQQEFVSTIVTDLIESEYGESEELVMIMMPYILSNQLPLSPEIVAGCADRAKTMKGLFFSNFVRFSRNPAMKPLLRSIAALYNMQGPHSEFWKELMVQIVLNNNMKLVQIEILKQLLDMKLSLFWEISEAFRKGSPQAWLDTICMAVAEKDRSVNRFIDCASEDAQEAIRMLTKKSCGDHPSSFVKRTILFFCELTAEHPRQQLRDAWKALDASALEPVYLMTISKWLDDELPDRKENGSVAVTEKTLPDFFAKAPAITTVN